MAIRSIRKYGDELLRKKSRKVEKIDKRLLTLIDDMFETMYNADGVGLAAPQVGILKRLVVIDVGEGPVVLINPEILETSGKAVDVEGCLSIPERQGEVERPTYVKAKALNEKGEEIVIEAEDLFARAICHETDHLNGVLFVDKLAESEGN
ncbi:peptide deformylase [Clostridium acetobutylicum]|uniref:Peptide deformylase 1 n=1 Tax=Clostridium acetobutylicum (strain ATCC 824 / DSM 792 / JCM 1419 / IAM 19013 / LMG 5710 / NBRC 13948 / NRRL B-527 / VKM B-1787 / 2291 / W) TaxID=272562 RepID=DEF1_CLOAB|nr:MULTISPECIES: peptide deformylase [Clostridium]O05100.1 RecName: Full=Peptide deformylase 1; Short=PDF 1; AltName: Full=Polypeptide deformylase 1 [Clostridium acetobutylicum ATCC 824]AAB50347.1 deformylase [Clostridium acetobutylicum ATCC 824]AAK79688.1 N-formylmethionyl-tRNA deformylase [Clostridium acetobutylicum ATCC 824]ADZ20772.1 peptide deformylase [Clostridium acetobutylicum EA 2018]AEI34045.1 peptide deformylase [Clostridium acetobutylicum DSM 1731]AWV79877.1 peptide deformylase [C